MRGRKGPQWQGEDCLGHDVSKAGSTWKPVGPGASHAHFEYQLLPSLPTGLRHAASFALQRSASSSAGASLLELTEMGGAWGAVKSYTGLWDILGLASGVPYSWAGKPVVCSNLGHS